MPTTRRPGSRRSSPCTAPGSALPSVAAACTRMPIPAQALTDALRLSRGMTYKAAICELPYGGGKSVVLADPGHDKTPELLRAMGRVIEGQGGRYITADDVGTTLADLAVMREVTRHTAGATPAAQEPLAVTAYGVLMAIEAAIRHYYQRARLRGAAFRRAGIGQCRLSLVRAFARARCRAGGQRRRSGPDRQGRARAAGRGRRAGGDLRADGRRVRPLRAGRRAERPDHPASARATGVRRGQQPAGRAAA